ncbi:hypothetical protein FC90_GL000370 [Latilactobacillus graminis DSM 20719]|uniref:Flavodoxin-like domain-containing protein n=2 Tax=Latilactobacillus graminis TaxID=60519 RepID=A0AA89I198_9LACO|nr:hypothetical protein FC90_GL000370 [Latilactobacillus graminis DSM 20719]
MYFSMSGATRQAAQELQNLTAGELFEIKPKIPYPTHYEDYTAVGKQQLDHQIEPELKVVLPSLEGYDLIFLGFPTWWQQPPMIIHTVLNDDELKGKIIVPFTTSMSSGIEDSVTVMRHLTKGSDLKIEDGFRYDPDKRRFVGKTKRLNLI